MYMRLLILGIAKVMVGKAEETESVEFGVTTEMGLLQKLHTAGKEGTHLSKEKETGGEG